MATNFPVDLGATVRRDDGTTWTAEIQDTSLHAMRLLAPVRAADGERLSVVVRLPDNPLTIDATVSNLRSTSDGRTAMGLRFELADADVRERLVAFLFVVAPRVQQARRDLGPTASASWPSHAASTPAPRSL